MLTPDSYLVDRESGELMKETVGHQKVMLDYCRGNEPVEVPFHRRNARKLSGTEVKAVVGVSKAIEVHLGFESADVEWAFAGNELNILQARPWSGFNVPVWLSHGLGAREEPTV